MAAAVADVFADGGVLLAEAGTGTGKTLAYLVPAILSRERVLISTGTKNLQEQIFFKDLPVLRDALGIPFTATYMKGRGNYLCLHRFEALKDSAAIRSRDEAIRDRASSTSGRRQTETGDRAEIDDLPEDLPFWHDIAATSENCIGADCPRYNDCFVTRMRQRAAESDVVIVNHHLLCADAAVRQSAFGEVIPSLPLRDRRRGAPARGRGHAVLRHRPSATTASTISPATSTARSRREADRRPGRADALRDDIDSVRDGARLVLRHAADAAVRDAGGSRSAESRDPRHGAAPARARGRRRARRSCARSRRSRRRSRWPRTSPEDVIALGRRAAELQRRRAVPARGPTTRATSTSSTSADAACSCARRRSTSRTIIRELLLDRMTATVLTSATLTRRRPLRLRPRAASAIREAHEARLASEFDYTRQAILYLPKNMPDPRSPQFAARPAREVVEILQRTRGRAFVLFTSYANLRAGPPARRPRDRLPDPRAGHRAASALLREFKATPNAVLFATSSFWQGVDVVGEALSCVIIDKLPFASPGDPITAARIEAINARRRQRVRRVPDPAGHPGAPAGPGAPDPPPPGSRRAGRPRPPAADDGLRTQIPGLFAARTRNARPRNAR